MESFEAIGVKPDVEDVMYVYLDGKLEVEGDRGCVMRDGEILWQWSLNWRSL